MHKATDDLALGFKNGVGRISSSPVLTMGYFYSPYYEVALAFALVLLALAAPSHFSSRNTGTILYICWVFLGTLITLINKLIWSDNVRNIAPVWCDISQSLRVLCFFTYSFTDKRSSSPRRPSSRPLHGWIPL